MLALLLHSSGFVLYQRRSVAVNRHKDALNLHFCKNVKQLFMPTHSYPLRWTFIVSDLLCRGTCVCRSFGTPTLLLPSVPTVPVSAPPPGCMQELCSQAEQQPEEAAPFLRALATVVVEFNPATATSTGLSWASHERCRQQFEAALLQPVFRCGSTLAMAAPLEATPAPYLAGVLSADALHHVLQRLYPSASCLAARCRTSNDAMKVAHGLCAGSVWRDCPALAEGCACVHQHRGDIIFVDKT